MTAPAEHPGEWFAFLDQRLQAAVHAVAAGDESPDDALRGLYISDEQALALAGDLGSQNADPRLELAAARLGLDALDAAVLAVCAAPELHPRYGRLYAYLQDDVTRRLASPRLVSALLSGDGVDARDVLACFAPDAPLMRAGAIRMLVPDPGLPLADRAVKVADRLAAFMLAAGRGLLEAGAPATIRRVAMPGASCPAGRRRSTRSPARCRPTRRLPLVVCGPDARAVVAAAAGNCRSSCSTSATSTGRRPSPMPP